MSGVSRFHGLTVHDSGVELPGLKVDAIECELGNDLGSRGGILGLAGELEASMGSFGFRVSAAQTKRLSAAGPMVLQESSW